MKKISNLLQCDLDIDIFGVSDDFHDIKQGYLFVATKGYNVDHFDFIDLAIENGAVALVVDRKVDAKVPYILVDNINSIYSEICKKFYDVSLNDFSLIGITGTDGKTTTSSIVQQILFDDFNCAYIGTNGLFVNGQSYHTNNTTPCISELYNCMSIIENNNCKAVSMEVSSEALLHKRVDGLFFDIVAITNITEDHLNVHKTIDNYKKCKFSLVKQLKNNGVVFVNGDDRNCKTLQCNNLYSFGFSTDNDYIISDFYEGKNGINFIIKDKFSEYEIYSPLFGRYNAYNICLAFIIGLYMKVPVDILLNKIKNINFVLGRGERLFFGQSFDIILDYAHTYNAIDSLLTSISGKYKRIITVTGAAGGREKEKRSKIGKLVLEKSDYVIFTMDDPRNEDVNSIIDDMISSSNNYNYERVIDRVRAIYKAFDIAQSGDVVLVIGKGRDNYMALAEGKVPYCDYDVIYNYFN